MKEKDETDNDVLIISIITSNLQQLNTGKIHLRTCLTLYHTIPTFNDLEKATFRKHCGKRRKYW